MVASLVYRIVCAWKIRLLNFYVYVQAELIRNSHNFHTIEIATMSCLCCTYMYCLSHHSSHGPINYSYYQYVKHASSWVTYLHVLAICLIRAWHGTCHIAGNLWGHWEVQFSWYSCIHKNQTHHEISTIGTVHDLWKLKCENCKNFPILILHAYECPGISGQMHIYFIHPVWYKYKAVTWGALFTFCSVITQPCQLSSDGLSYSLFSVCYHSNYFYCFWWGRRYL